MKLAILGSTNGTDAQYILQSIHDKTLHNISVECIISNRSKSGILNKAETFNIPGIFVSAKDKIGNLISREQYDSKIINILEEYNVDYILMIGWMRILSKKFVDRWKNKILNIHPSLLPAYEGDMDMNIHRAVIKRGCKITGATLIFVDEGADTGPIIDQTHIRVYDDDTPTQLKTRVQKAEKDLFMRYLPLLRDGKLKVEHNKVYINK